MPLFPGQAPRSLALMFFMAGVLFLLGGLVQINPIWQWGPFEPWQATNGAQPDWYLGWLIGALRLMPSFDVTIGHFTLVPNPFWGGVLFPLFVVGVLGPSPGSSAVSPATAGFTTWPTAHVMRRPGPRSAWPF